MKRVLGLINLSDSNGELGALTHNRCLSSLPFGGRYRVIDFLLSSMVNSQITNVGVFTSQKYRSLVHYLGKGQDWDLSRKQDGLFIFPYEMKSGLKKIGDLPIFHANLDYFEKSSQQYILLSNGTPLIHMDFREALQSHIETCSDITLIYRESREQSGRNHPAYLRIDDEETVTAISSESGPFFTEHEYLGILLMKKDLFLHIIDTYHEENLSFMDVLAQADHGLHISGYAHDGLYASIETVQDYYHWSMMLLDPVMMRDVLRNRGETFTKLRDEPPAKYGDHAKVANSLIANGCVIEGDVENSILFGGVHVKKGSTVKNSILLHRCSIGENATLSQTILDKEVTVRDDHTIIGCFKEPFVVAKKTIV